MADDAAEPMESSRAFIADEIERLIGLLDAWDGDDDVEPDESLEGDTADDAPSLGAIEYERSSGGWTLAAPPQTRHDVDLEGDDADNEPSLGSTNTNYNSTGWDAAMPTGSAANADRELDDSDDEPSLGSITAGNQERWAQPAFCDDDRELDDESEPEHDAEGPSHPTDWDYEINGRLTA